MFATNQWTGLNTHAFIIVGKADTTCEGISELKEWKVEQEKRKEIAASESKSEGS